MRKIIVGTRGSKLALAQTEGIIRECLAYANDVDFEIKVIKTKGDLIQDVALEKIGDKGLFVSEIETQLLAGDIDMAVHSMKDMPSFLTSGLIFAPVPKRVDARDVLVLKSPYKNLSDLPAGAVIGTGSKRRKFQLLAMRPDLTVVPIRGNIDTRMNKIETEGLDGVILAAAGLIRAGYEDKISMYLEPNVFIPAPAQGVLALQIRAEDDELLALLTHMGDLETQITVDGERGFLEGIGGTCHQPIGAYGKIEGSDFVLTGLYGDEEGKLVIETARGAADSAKKIGLALGKALKKRVFYDG